MSKIEMGRTYRTRDGREVRIYAVDCGGLWPVHGAINVGTGWQVKLWQPDGKIDGTTDTVSDLIEVRPRIKREVWVNVYPETTHIADTKEDAEDMAHLDRIACVKLVIDCEEGEGLSNG